MSRDRQTDLDDFMRQLRGSARRADQASMSWIGIRLGDPEPPKPPSLADAVAQQVKSLTRGFKGKGHREMPRPPLDLSTYRDAFASARANCDHEDAVEVLWEREWRCDDCHSILGRAEARKAGLI